LTRYRLVFLEPALDEWHGLDAAIREQFRKKLRERLEHPHVKKDRLRGSLKGLYKIKLRASGFRLVYRVFDDRRVVSIVVVGKREGSRAYRLAQKRLTK
jgi:mRNA interferase RelE/StbE